jgi:hypothetical protein
VRLSSPLVYICNPNNPIASLTLRNDLETFIGKLPASTFVVIDETYHHYAGESSMYASFIDRPFDSERVIVTRTFSKADLCEGLVTDFHPGKLAPFEFHNSLSNLSRTVDGNSVRRSSRRSELVFVAKEWSPGRDAAGRKVRAMLSSDRFEPGEET